MSFVVKEYVLFIYLPIYLFIYLEGGVLRFELLLMIIHVVLENILPWC